MHSAKVTSKFRTDGSLAYAVELREGNRVIAFLECSTESSALDVAALINTCVIEVTRLRWLMDQK
jgi:hypothetical protein